MTDNLEPWLDIISYGRGSPSRGQSLSIAQIKQITRTVGRTPEVMLKVVNKGSSSSRAVQGHLGYIGRKGDVELETDDGEILQGKDVGNALLEAWNLDLMETRGKINLTPNYFKKLTRIRMRRSSDDGRA